MAGFLQWHVYSVRIHLKLLYCELRCNLFCYFFQLLKKFYNCLQDILFRFVYFGNNYFSLLPSVATISSLYPLLPSALSNERIFTSIQQAVKILI